MAKKKSSDEKRELILSAEEHERIGRDIENVINTKYANKRKAFGFSFATGVFTGMGSVLGASLLILLIAWVLSGLEQIPFVGDLFENINQTIENSRKR